MADTDCDPDVAASTLVRDQLNSVRAIFDAAGAKERHTVFAPYGTAEDTVTGAELTGETKGWIGKRYDAGAGLQFLNARYYDQEPAFVGATLPRSLS